MGVAACCCPGWAATWKAGHNKLTSSRRQAGPENWWKPANIFSASTRYFYTPRLTAGLVWPWCDVTAHWCHVSLWTHVKTGQGCLHHTMTLATVPRTGGLITQHGLGCEDGAMAGWSPETSRCKEQELEITQLALGSLPPLSSAARRGGAGRLAEAMAAGRRRFLSAAADPSSGGSEHYTLGEVRWHDGTL